MKILTDNIDLLWRALNNIKNSYDFELIAYVFIPDHFHIIIKPLDKEISNILQRIKMSFASYFRRRHNVKMGRVWQHRFFDHIIRNQEDLNRHIDYIHFNPVKHGFVTRPSEWEHSSYNEYVRSGYYEEDWGVREDIDFEGEYGE